MRYLAGFLITIGLLVLAIILIVHHGGGSKGKVPATKAPLTSYANSDTVVRITADGPINAPEDHRQEQVTVGKDNTTFDIYRGYDGQSMHTQSYGMTVTAYDDFLHALELNGFTLGNDSKDLKDERGHCAEGNRYIYEIIQNGNSIERYWSTSCSSGVHSFEGNASVVQDLFRAQVPNLDDLDDQFDVNLL